jgi:hypothetical protein
MQITVTIPDEVAAEAQARGLTPENYVESLIAEQKLMKHADKTPLNREERLANLEKFFEEISAHSEKIPILPDEAYTRESFYSDHD